eukprot:CAMPEP_0116956276 /NCGR_PEP_ID=MMETSP0467-20121206/43224_1 /TAXON_ID=283647 /ORGANISM="Mesodinium pulex, Strain SPMC105" /LENGTH=102 /DNA_ID=CAMNT_0004642693 /DNA_START=21 /DNA_END=329 /DNA_ORIENTATION=+
MKKLRACVCCRLVKGEDQFVKEGCNNCEFFGMKDDMGRVIQCTSPNFEGLIAILNPYDSWVTKYTQNRNFKPGMYAIDVTGDLTEEIVEILEEYKQSARISN